jgi:hypothetical protein
MPVPDVGQDVYRGFNVIVLFSTVNGEISRINDGNSIFCFGVSFSSVLALTTYFPTAWKFWG